MQVEAGLFVQQGLSNCFGLPPYKDCVCSPSLDVVRMACPPPQSLSRTEPRVSFDVVLCKPLGIVLEELPGRVFVASLAKVCIVASDP